MTAAETVSWIMLTRKVEVRPYFTSVLEFQKLPVPHQPALAKIFTPRKEPPRAKVRPAIDFSSLCLQMPSLRKTPILLPSRLLLTLVIYEGLFQENVIIPSGWWMSCSPTVGCVALGQSLGLPLLSLCCHLSQDERVSQGSLRGSFRKQNQAWD